MDWQTIRIRHWLALGVILLLAASVRGYRLGGNSLWTDEYLSLECSSGWGRSDLSLAGTTARIPDYLSLKPARPWTAIWSVIAADENHPPLYFLTLRGRRSLFGDSAVALRSLSVTTALLLNRRPTDSFLKELASARHICLVASSCNSIAWASIPGMKVNHVEMLVGMAMVATEDRSQVQKPKPKEFVALTRR